MKPAIDKKIAIVFLDWILDNNDCRSIVIDNVKAGCEVTKHLLQHGCKNIGHITANTNLAVYKDRLKGYNLALSEADLPFIKTNIITNNLSENDGIAAAETIQKMNKKVDAAFSANDNCAVSCILKLMHDGVRIPEDIAFARFNNDPISRIIQPNLTTINYPAFEMSEVAAKSFINHLDGHSNIQSTNAIILKSGLIIRASPTRNQVIPFYNIRYMKKILSTTIAIFLTSTIIFAQNFITENPTTVDFPLATSSNISNIYIDSNDDWLVQKTAIFLQNDIQLITGKQPNIINILSKTSSNIIIIGTTNQSVVIKNLIKAKKLNIIDIQGKWEAYKIIVVNNPYPNVRKAVVIIGSDKRGTAYGVFELSKQMGISPWYWWADVPAKEKKNVFIKAGSYTFSSPKVKYRGIFINDEAPAFSSWTKEKFGGVNHLAYEKIFELLLRLKANYLWPAMWGNAFNDDDTLNPILADKYGIVMGTSHHEPMLRAQTEWKRYGKGAWNYNTNDTVLKNFWRKGIVNMKNHESIVTIGMRGDGDEPMTTGTATALLEKIVADQRKILEEVTQKKASETPQLWALYKEVQDYYDKGMRVPDDVTLLLCDDNWGNIRKLPKIGDKKRSGGYGIYYHFDYVGDPRNYKWINTNNIARVWEQMHLAYEYGVDKIWIVNVGDIKPMEFPISFFLDYAWDPTKWNENNLSTYYTNWATQQFGKHKSTEICKIITKYSQISARRKPELLLPETYSQLNYNELDRVTNELENLEVVAQKINDQLAPNYKDAYFQLVLHPIKALSNLQQLYTTVAYNKFAVKNKQASANMLADKAKNYYLQDSLISLEYNHLANGKWNHMMDQTHIGYTYWQQPLINKMPEVKYVLKDSIEPQMILIKSGSISAKKIILKNTKSYIFYEKDGYVSIEAEHYTKAINTNGITWKKIPDIGKTGSGITAFPVTTITQKIALNSPHIEYNFTSYDSATTIVNAYFSPTLDFHNKDGLHFAISIDGEQPQIIDLHENFDNKAWMKAVSDNIIIKTSSHKLSKSGIHTLKFWMIDSGIILQKLVLDFGGLKPSYLGPEETIHTK